MKLSEKNQLRIPGPSPVPPQVQRAMNQAMIGHRSSEASQLIRDCSDRLQKILGTQQNPLLLTSSGTSALEASIVNTVQPGEKAIIVVTGAFGDRFAKIAQKYQIQAVRLDIPWGKACEPQVLASVLQKHPDTKAVFLTYCETSTGVLNPIQSLAQAVHEQSDALVIVDGVSCIGAVPSQMDAWGIDILVTGSQKALMCPPGLAIVAVSEKAWRVIEENTHPRFYLNLLTYRKELAKDTTPYTPSITLLYALQAALDLIEEEGLDQVIKRHQLIKDMTRAGIDRLGLRLMTDEVIASPTVTSIHGGGNEWSSEDLRKILKQHGVIFAGGQQHLKGKIFRIGHMGYCDPADILSLLSILEISLHQLQVPVELGQGVRAAQEVYLQHV